MVTQGKDVKVMAIAPYWRGLRRLLHVGHDEALAQLMERASRHPDFSRSSATAMRGACAAVRAAARVPDVNRLMDEELTDHCLTRQRCFAPSFWTRSMYGSGEHNS